MIQPWHGCTNTCSSPFTSFGFVPRSGIAELHGNFMCNFFKELQYPFPQWLYHFIFLTATHKQCTMFQFFHILAVLVSLFLFSFHFFSFLFKFCNASHLNECERVHLIVVSWMFLKVIITKSHPFFRPACLLLLCFVKTSFPRMSFWAIMEGKIVGIPCKKELT